MWQAAFSSNSVLKNNSPLCPREPAVKSVGKPDAENPHVQFDERGSEAGRYRVEATAPFLDSTIP
jgi:hypothetical protein